MIEIDKPKIEIVDLSTQGSRSVGKFVVEPLERGFGATLGNGKPGPVSVKLREIYIEEARKHAI